jgi:hypothetical protein
MLCLSYYLLCFLLTKLEKKRAEQVLPGSEAGWEGGEERGERGVGRGSPNNVYAYE